MSEGVASLCIGLDKAIYRKLIVSLIGVILLCLIEEARIFSYFCIVSGHVSSYLGFRYLLRRRCFYLVCRLLLEKNTQMLVPKHIAPARLSASRLDPRTRFLF